MTGFESIFFWATALFLAVSFFLSLLALQFKKPKPFSIALYVVVGAFVTLTVFGITRWINTGHPPFVTLFESMITSIWFVLLIFLIVRIRLSQSAILQLPVSAITFLMVGWSSSLAQEASPLSAALTNVWLFIHASFATAGASSFLIASSFATVYLMGEQKLLSLKQTMPAIPDHKSLPKTILNFLIFGLILWGVMIVSGSIWAHVAWGRYWAWDPIELWSLIGWLSFGLLLHTRLTFKLSHATFCRLTILAAAVVVFSLWGVHYIYETIHSYG